MASAPNRGAPLTSVGADVSLQVKGVIEALPTVGAQVPLDVIVTLHVAVQHALVGEGLLADVAGKEVSAGTVPQSHLGARTVFVTDTQELGLQIGRLGGHKHQPLYPTGKAVSAQRPHLCAAGSQSSRVAGLGGICGSTANLLLGSQVCF